MAKKKIKTTPSKKKAPKGLFQIHKNLKWLLPLLLVVIVIYAFVPILKEKSYNMETNDDFQASSQAGFNKTYDISNWKTYTNTKYGYSIKYPANWIKNAWQE